MLMLEIRAKNMLFQRIILIISDPNAFPEVYAYGIRMPWRCSVDRRDPDTGEGEGRIFCPDVGTDVQEEVNIVEKGGNYEYPVFEGDVCLVDNQTCSEGMDGYMLNS